MAKLVSKLIPIFRCKQKLTILEDNLKNVKKTKMMTTANDMKTAKKMKMIPKSRRIPKMETNPGRQA